MVGSFFSTVYVEFYMLPYKKYSFPKGLRSIQGNYFCSLPGSTNLAFCFGSKFGFILLWYWYFFSNFDFSNFDFSNFDFSNFQFPIATQCIQSSSHVVVPPLLTIVITVPPRSHHVIQLHPILQLLQSRHVIFLS